MGEFNTGNFMGEFEDFLKGDENYMESNGFENQVPEQHLASFRHKAIGAILFVGGGLDVAAALETKWNIMFKGLATVPAIGSMLIGFSLFRGHSSLSTGHVPTSNEFPPDETI